MRTTSRNLLMAAAVVTMLNFNSCKKYEDGPGFSLKSKKGRLAGDWEVVKIEGSNGQNYLDGDGYELEFEFDKDGDFKYKQKYSYDGYSYTYSYKGDWEFSSDKEELEIDLDNGPALEFEIKRLTNSELWLEDQDGNEWELEAI